MNDVRLKRKISLHNINAITVSNIGPEFVIHVSKEYDYRYCSDKKNIILNELVKTVLQATKKASIPCYLSDKMYLEDITKTKFDDKKKVISYMIYQLTI